MPESVASEDEPESKPESPDTDTVNNFPERLPEEDRDQFLEQYLHYADAALETSSHRIQTNRTFGIILTTVLAGLFGIAQGEMTVRGSGTVLVGAIIGLVSCFSWRESVKSYRRLNNARYSILNKMEEELPAPLYKDEWRYLDRQQPDPEIIEPRESDTKHKRHTIVETRYILALSAGYAVIGIYGLVKLGALLQEAA